MARGCFLLLVFAALFLVVEVVVLAAEAAARERTLAMVKPDGVRASHTEAIKAIIRSSGFYIAQEKTLQLDVETAEAFYSEHTGKTFFGDLIDFMTSGSVVAMVLEHDNAVVKWRSLIGPTDPERAQREQPNSIRAMFGSNTTQNCVHGSDSLVTAEREIRILFKDSQADEHVMMGHDEL